MVSPGRGKTPEPWPMPREDQTLRRAQREDFFYPRAEIRPTEIQTHNLVGATLPDWATQLGRNSAARDSQVANSKFEIVSNIGENSRLCKIRVQNTMIRITESDVFSSPNKKKNTHTHKLDVLANPRLAPHVCSALACLTTSQLTVHTRDNHSVHYCC